MLRDSVAHQQVVLHEKIVMGQLDLLLQREKCHASNERIFAKPAVFDRVVRGSNQSPRVGSPFHNRITLRQHRALGCLDDFRLNRLLGGDQGLNLLQNILRLGNFRREATKGHQPNQEAQDAKP